MQQILKFFKLKEKNTTVKTELFAGLTTFLSMAYILIVNPMILADSGMDQRAVFTATAVAAIVATLIMGIYANYPVALAPGMGMNAFFTYTIVYQYSYSWQMALAAVFCSGVVFVLISLTGIREKVINAIPQDLKHAVGAGIGLFVALIGFKNAGLVVADGATLVTFGKLNNPLVILAVISLILTVILYVKKVPAAILVGMIITTIIGVIWQALTGIEGLPTLSQEVIAQFKNIPALALILFAIASIVVLKLKKVNKAALLGIGATVVLGGLYQLVAVLAGLPKIEFPIFTSPIAPDFGAFITGFTQLDWSFSGILTFLFIVISIGFVDFFDTAGTLVSVGSRSGLLDENGELQGSGRALIADSLGTVVGAIVGTSNTTSYVESLSGVEVGGRTGLTSVFTAIFFFISLFFFSIFGVVTGQVTSAALIFVGILMATQLGEIEWTKYEIAIPAFFTLVIMPFAYSIATGIAVGFIFYAITMVCSKRHKEVSITMYVLAGVFLVYFIVTSIL